MDTSLLSPSLLEEEFHPSPFDPNPIGMDTDRVPRYGPCRRCRQPYVLVSSVEIRYPSVHRHIDLCRECANQVMNALDQALVQAGI